MRALKKRRRSDYYSPRLLLFSLSGGFNYMQISRTVFRVCEIETWCPVEQDQGCERRPGLMVLRVMFLVRSTHGMFPLRKELHSFSPCVVRRKAGSRVESTWGVSWVKTLTRVSFSDSFISKWVSFWAKYPSQLDLNSTRVKKSGSSWVDSIGFISTKVIFWNEMSLNFPRILISIVS